MLQQWRLELFLDVGFCHCWLQKPCGVLTTTSRAANVRALFLWYLKIFKRHIFNFWGLLPDLQVELLDCFYRSVWLDC